MTKHPPVGPRTPEEVRRSNRALSELQMMLILHREGKEIGHTVWTIDISRSGARIKLKGTLIPGQSVHLLPAEDSRNSYPCRVVWFSSPGPERLSEAGLEFKTPWMVSKQDLSDTVGRA
jgi:hypothetical protein